MEELILRILKIDHTVVICSNEMKKAIKSRIMNEKKLVDITYKTFTEAAYDIFGNYQIEARIKLAIEKKITPELSTILLKNSMLVTPQYQNEKIYELLKIKQHYSNYLNDNPLAINLYKGKIVFVVNDFGSHDLFNKAIQKIKVVTTVINYQIDKKIPKILTINKYKTMKDEVQGFLKEVSRLITLKIDPKRIRVHKLSKEYQPYVLEIFSLSNIDIVIEEKNSLIEYEATKTFLKAINDQKDENIQIAFSKALQTMESSSIKNEIIDVLNPYLLVDNAKVINDIYEDLLYSFKTTPKKISDYNNCIKVSDLLDSSISEDDYVFILGFNQDIFPLTHKNEDYLLDSEKEKLGLTTSKDKNLNEKRSALELIHHSKNLYLSYCLNNGTQSLVPSSFIKNLKDHYEVNETNKLIDYKISYSEILDRINLGKQLDNYYKYDIKNDDLYLLYKNYPTIEYLSYNHKFKGLSEESIEKKNQKKYILSYTSIDQYYKCAYLFYLEKILKIKRSTNEEALYIGNLFHECLHRLLLETNIEDPKSFLEKTIETYLEKTNKIPTKKEQFFIKKYQEVLLRWYFENKRQMENSDFKVLDLEKEFSIVGDVNIIGKIDKILTCKIGDCDYAIVVDYKSGYLDFDLNRIEYGLNMQIPFYFYFLKSCLDNKYHFAGGYLQQILPNSEFSYDPKFSIEDQYVKHFRLKGYTNPNIKVLKRIDNNFETSSFIHSMKLNKDSSFAAYTLPKLIDDEKFEKLVSKVEEKINNATRDIQNGNYIINPKKFKNFDSCDFCPYRDLCYRDELDYQDLEIDENYEFLEEKI